MNALITAISYRWQINNVAGSSTPPRGGERRRATHGVPVDSGV
ncbi:hypothetical protein [Actinoplanes sp. DH11]|nr:hypothetical protein [Actinoplanes sp. DH11]